MAENSHIEGQERLNSKVDDANRAAKWKEAQEKYTKQKKESKDFLPSGHMPQGVKTVDQLEEKPAGTISAEDIAAGRVPPRGKRPGQR